VPNSPDMKMTQNNNDEPPKENRRLPTSIWVISTGLFIISLFNNCLCTEDNCINSAVAFLFGGFAVLSSGAAISWLANPLLIVSWILIYKKKKAAWMTALPALMLCLSFLMFHSVIKDEAGNFSSIASIGTGYWLWLISVLVTLCGALLLNFLFVRPCKV